MGGVVVDGEGDSSSDIGGYGERCSTGIKAEGEDEGASPAWAKAVESGEGAEDLGLIGSEGWRHSLVIVSQQKRSRVHHKQPTQAQIQSPGWPSSPELYDPF